MLRKIGLCLSILSSILLSGCLINGKIVDDNGVGVAGIKVTLSGTASMTTTTRSDGKYQFGGSYGWLTAGEYTITPAGDCSPANEIVTISTQDLNGSDVPWPVNEIDFEIAAVPLFNLSVGTTFTYLVTELSNSSNSWVSTSSVKNSEIVGSNTYYTIQIVNQYGNDQVESFKVRCTPNEFYIFDGKTDHLWFKTGVVGYEFIRDIDGDNDKIRINSKDVITVPYGTITAYEFTIWDSGDTSPYLIQSVSPGIGIVAELNYDDGIQTELISVTN